MSSAARDIVELSAVPHPGENVLEYLAFFGWSQSDLARRSGLTPKTISGICNGKNPITPQTALAFERVLQRPAHFWLALQRQYDEAEARRKENVREAGWNDWHKAFPVAEMKKLQFSLPPGASETESLLKFFGVSSPQSWTSVWKASAVAYRQTRSIALREGAIAAWVRETEIEARQFDLSPFDDKKLAALIPSIRSLSRIRIDKAIDSIQTICASAGVAVVIVPALKNTGISGCARWTSENKALIGLTLRYKTDDQFWFTLFHELGHVLLHRHQRFVLDNVAEDLEDDIVDPEMQKVEDEANRFSADQLIPPASLGTFTRKGDFSSKAIHDFSEAQGVGPGIVVGRLQHDGFLKAHEGNTLKQKLDWQFKE